MNITPKQALEVLSKAMQEDYDYAWSWHCNVAMAAIDAGAPHREANARAAMFMRSAFGVDTRLPPTWLPVCAQCGATNRIEAVSICQADIEIGDQCHGGHLWPEEY